MAEAAGFSPNRLGQATAPTAHGTNVDHERRIGYVPAGQAVPDGMASIPITLPSPKALREASPIDLGHLLREAVGQCATAIAAVHDYEHQAFPDGGEHAATSEVSESVRMLLTDTYGDDPQILVALLMEVILWMALNHDNDDETPTPEEPTDER